MQLTTAAITQSNGGPSPTRTRNPYPCIANLADPFPDAMCRERNAFWLGTAAWSRHTDAPKGKAETLAGHVDALRSDADSPSRDLGAQKGNADVQKINADAEKGNADAKKINADVKKDNVFAKPESSNDLIRSSLHRSSTQNPITSI